MTNGEAFFVGFFFGFLFFNYQANNTAKRIEALRSKLQKGQQTDREKLSKDWDNIRTYYKTAYERETQTSC